MDDWGVSEGLDPMSDTDSISKEDLLEEITRLEQKLGRIPSAAVMVGRGRYNHTDYIDEFGGWEQALEAAGFDSERLRTERYTAITDEAFLEKMSRLRNGDRESQYQALLLLELRRLAIDLGRTPTATEMNSFGEYSREPYRSRWSWSEAVRKAGLEPNQGGGVRVSSEDLIAELLRLKDQLGRRPTLQDLQERGRYSHTPYYREFGSWVNACDAAFDE